MCIPIISFLINDDQLSIWVNYNDLTATSLESWLIRQIIPQWLSFRLVKYHNLPRSMLIYLFIDLLLWIFIEGIEPYR
jgi:hypothetical protein